MISVDVIQDKSSLKSMRNDWNVLLEQYENKDVLHSHQWYHSWANSFLSDEEMLIVVAKDSDKLRAIFPLIKSNYCNKCFNIKIIKSMSNLQTLRFDYITDEPSPELLGTLLRKAFNVTKCRMMMMEVVPETSLILRHLHEACKLAGYKYIIRLEEENCLIRMDSSFDDYFNSLDSKFKKNIRAAERKASKCGSLALVQPNSLEDLPDFLERGFKVEANSWKGEEGTAINQNKYVRDFYTQLAFECFESGWLDLDILKSNGDDIAFYYCLGNFEAIRASKIGVDRQFRNIGPGMLITKKMLEKTFEEKKYRLWDFCGDSARWKRDWSNEIEKNYKIFIFKDDIVSKGLYTLCKHYDKNILLKHHNNK